MKGLLQNIKGFFSRYFPLHLNATVVALEESLADRDFALDCYKRWTEVLQRDIDSLVLTNNAYRRDNMGLMEALKDYQRELEALYRAGLPSTLPVQVDVKVGYSAILDMHAVSIRVPEFRLAMQARDGLMSRGRCKYIAEYMSEQVARAVQVKVLELLNAEPREGN